MPLVVVAASLAATSYDVTPQVKVQGPIKRRREPWTRGKLEYARVAKSLCRFSPSIYLKPAGLAFGEIRTLDDHIIAWSAPWFWVKA